MVRLARSRSARARAFCANQGGSLLDDTEYANRVEVSILAPPQALSGIGTEAWLVQPAPGLFEAWVSGTHGRFKVGAQAKESAIALATLAAGRD